jgi:uncharacterized protein YabE (DUF348 family)
VPYDPDAWLPLPDPRALPPIADISLDAIVSPSPARAAPHDPASWMPLPADVDALPSVDELLAPPPAVRAAVLDDADSIVRDAAAAAEAAVAPSPARAAPHDPAAWLPVPDPDRLVTIPELAPGDVSAARPTAGGTRRRFGLGVRALLVVAVVAAAAVVTVRVVGSGAAPAASSGAYEVTVDLDGVVSTVRTSATRAPDLMRELHVGKLVAVRNIPGHLHDGSVVVLRRRHEGTLAVDDQRIVFDSASRTVDELLTSYHVLLVGEDYVRPAPDAVLSDGQTVTVFRVGGDTKQRYEDIPPVDEHQPDPNTPIGQTSELRAGVPGQRTITYRERIENGVKVGETVVSDVRTREPVSHLIGDGTLADWHWDKLAECESGGRWNTVDHSPGGYHGGLGIAQTTWVAFGGRDFAPTAAGATREEQITVGERIRARYGWTAWGCGRYYGW